MIRTNPAIHSKWIIHFKRNALWPWSARIIGHTVHKLNTLQILSRHTHTPTGWSQAGDLGDLKCWGVLTLTNGVCSDFYISHRGDSNCLFDANALVVLRRLTASYGPCPCSWSLPGQTLKNRPRTS
jgi:hypothetical protein